MEWALASGVAFELSTFTVALAVSRNASGVMMICSAALYLAVMRAYIAL